MNNELGRVEKGGVVALSFLRSWHMSEGSEENHKKTRQSKWSSLRQGKKKRSRMNKEK
jgi:hypothetical protein